MHKIFKELIKVIFFLEKEPGRVLHFLDLSPEEAEVGIFP